MKEYLQNLIAAIRGKSGIMAEPVPAKQPDNGRLPQPGRYGAGMYPNWRAMLEGSLWAQRIQPINPDDARNGIDNSIVSICINWIATSWQVAKPQIGTMKGGEFRPLPGDPHPFLQTMEAPLQAQDEYSNLIWALISDFIRYGNAYAHLVKGRDGSIQALEHISARFVRPVPDEFGRLWYYAYNAQSEIIPLAMEDILHLKHGSMEIFPLLGVSPLAPQYREIVTDNAYSDYSGGLAMGGGIPPLMFSPKVLKTSDGETYADLDADTADALTRQFSERIQSEPGRTRFVSGAVDMHQMGIEPDKMALNDVRAMPETRIPAALGLPPLLLQLYTGVQRSTYSNLSEAIKQGWRGCVIPLQTYFAKRITHQVLRQYPDAVARKLVFRYDTSDVTELQSDRSAEWAASRADYAAGLITLEEARADRGRPTTPAIMDELKPAAAEPEEQQEDTAAVNAEDSATNAGKSMRGRRVRSKRETQDSGKSLTEVITEFRRALRAREADTVQEMSDALSAVEQRVLADLDDLLQQMDDAAEAGDEISEAWIARQDRYQTLLVAIDKQYSALGVSATPALIQAQRDYVALSAGSAKRMTDAAAGAPPVAGLSLSWVTLPTPTLEAAAGYASDGSPLADLLTALGPDAKDSVKSALLGGIGSGYNPKKTASVMRESVEAKLALTRNRAETIARTETMRAAREASRQTYQANSAVLESWIWTASGDARCCASCWAMDGTVHPLEDELDDHCNGRCAMVPRTKSWAEITGDDTLPDTRPEIEPGVDKFAKLSEDEQRSVLGNTLHGLYASGKIALTDCVVQDSDERWGTMRRAATVTEAVANAKRRRGDDEGDE